MRTIQTKSYEKTQKLGEEFTQSLHGGDVICLRGDLGAGKTTFMQGLAKGLGIKQRIISPTFIIVRKYKIPNRDYSSSESANADESRSVEGISSREARTISTLYHIDLYRTETEDDLKGLGIPEILQEQGAVIAIEWAGKLGSLLPEKRWELDFAWISENERKIQMEKFD